MGTPQFSVPILEMLSKKHHVLAVITQPDKKVGRKKEIVYSPVKTKAISLNLPVFQPIQLKTDYQFILELNPDLIVTAAYGQMLPKELLNQVTAINVHGSILPTYRGGAPIQYALFDGLSETGVTIMYMAFKMDSGDIIKQDKIHIDEDDDYQSLSQKLSILGVKLLEEVLDDLTHGYIIRIPQDEKQVTFAKTLTYQDEMISFEWSSDKIINRIRGLSPEIGASATINGVVLKIYKAKKSDIMTLHQAPGTILQSKKKLIIKTIDGSIEVLEIQAPGKKKMSVSDFLNGQNIIKDGDVFIEGMN